MLFYIIHLTIDLISMILQVKSYIKCCACLVPLWGPVVFGVSQKLFNGCIDVVFVLEQKSLVEFAVAETHLYQAIHCAVGWTIHGPNHRGWRWGVLLVTHKSIITFF